MPSTAQGTSSTTTSPESATTSNATPPILKSYSCVLCAQRKVKCDKAPGGCSNCTKARVSCIYKAPPPPRRRKKGTREIDVHARLKLYEDTLRKLGVDPSDLESEEVARLSGRKVKGGDILEKGLNGEADGVSQVDKDPGILVADQGKSRYLENSLWTGLQNEFRQSREILDDDDSSDDEVLEGVADARFESPFDGTQLLFGTPRAPNDLRALHPQPVQIFKLWQTYLENIHPLVKVCHTPSIQQVILNASGNLHDLSKPVEALLFAMYSISLNSLGDAECQAVMGEPKSGVTARFRTGIQCALINASFLKTSDTMVLQALVLFLLSLQNFDGGTLWILTGITRRIAQRLGLHRDGQSLGLSPFDTEMRRRLWWQIMMLDGFAEKLAGTGGDVFLGDTKIPANLNDSDLFPKMKELPKEHEGATEMMFFLIRCNVGMFLKKTSNGPGHFDGVWNKIWASVVSVSAKDKAIDDLEATFQRKFLQYCDPSVPWHFMCTFLARSIIFMMRFVAHNPEHYGPNPELDLPQDEKDLLFDMSLQVTTFSNMAYTSKELQGYLWHVTLHFPWKAFIYLLASLRHRTEGPDVDKAWKEIALVYEFHPNFAVELSRKAIPNSRGSMKAWKAFPIAIGKLTLRAWDAFTAARGVPEKGEPYFIQMLRSRNLDYDRKKSQSIPSEATPPSEPSRSSKTHTSPSSAQPSVNFTAEASTLAPSNSTFTTQPNPLDTFQWDANFAQSLDAPPVVDLPALDPDQMNWTSWDNLLADYQMVDIRGGWEGPPDTLGSDLAGSAPPFGFTGPAFNSEFGIQ